MKMRRISVVLVVGLLAALVAAQAGLAAQQFDLGGRTVRFSLFFSDTTPLGAPGEYSWFEPDARLQAHIESVEEMFNVNIEFIRDVSSHDVARVAAQVLTGEAEFDVGHVRDVDLEGLAAEGLIYPLDGIIDEDFYNSLPPSFARESGTTFGGVTYGFEPMVTFVESQVILWNKDLFEAEGLPNLYELYEAGEWTWDKLEEIAIAATKDTTGDGEIDQWGFNFYWGYGGWWTFDYLTYWMLTNEATLTKTVDGREVVNFDSPEAIETFEFLQRLSQEHNVVTNQGGLQEGKVAMSFAMAQTLHYDVQKELTDDYGIVPPPRGPNATQHYLPDWNRWLAVLPITAQDPEALVEITKALWQLTEEYIDVDLETWEDRYWNTMHAGVVRDRESLEIWRKETPNTVLPQYMGFVKDAGFNEAANRIINDGASVSATVAELKPAVQAMLDELFDQ